MYPKIALVLTQKQNTNIYKMKQFYFIMTILLSLTIWSCKTKSIDQTRGSANEYKVVEVDCLKSYFIRHSTTQVQSETSHQELLEALSQLNVNFSGDHIEDKLDVLLTQTAEGTKLSFQGKGTAGYTESNSKEISTLRQDFAKYKDSLTNIIKSENQHYFEQSQAEWNKRLKEVKSKTFTPAVWLIIGLAVVIGMCLNWVSKKIKPFIGSK